MRTYNKHNCVGLVRAEFIDRWGRKIILTGIHAFDWQIHIVSIIGNISTEHFEKGAQARRRFSELKRKR